MYYIPGNHTNLSISHKAGNMQAWNLTSKEASRRQKFTLALKHIDGYHLKLKTGVSVAYQMSIVNINICFSEENSSEELRCATTRNNFSHTRVHPKNPKSFTKL